MDIVKKILALSALAATALSAMAGEPDIPMKDHGGMSIGAGIGYGSMSISKMDNTVISNVTGIDPSSPGDITGISYSNKIGGLSWRSQLGYLFGIGDFAVGLMVGFGANQSSLSVATYSRGKTHFYFGFQDRQSNYYDFLAIGKYYFPNNFNIYFKLGPAVVHQKYQFLELQNGVDNILWQTTRYQTLLEVALGFGYEFGSGLNVGVTGSYIAGAQVRLAGIANQIAPFARAGDTATASALFNQTPAAAIYTILMDVSYKLNF